MALLNSKQGSQPASPNSDLVGDDTDTGEQDTGTEEQPDDGAGDETDEGDDDRKVICTILRDKDGKYTLVTGDEPDDVDELAAPEGASPAEGGTPSLPEGQQFDEIGPLLKGVLDLLREDQGATADGGQASFEDGFNGGKPAAQ